MKIAILGDTHFGVRNDLSVFHKSFEKFYTDFIQYLIDNEIKIVFQLGDLFDRRKYINYYSLSECKRYFFDKLAENNIRLYTLIGNHDIYWRESLEVNAQSLILGEYTNIIAIDKPTTIGFSGDTTSFDFIPWICPENEKEVYDFIKASKSDICLGHFEIAGFAMYKGMEAHHGLDREMFTKYAHTWSGHYHTRSKKDNITYVGTPCEMTWQDAYDPKGFHVFDTGNFTLEFIENPHRIFIRIEYDDENIVELDSLDLKDCFVRVVVVAKSDPYKFDQFIQKLYNKGCYEVKLIEDISEFQDGEIGEEIDLEDTMDVLSNYIDTVETDTDKEKVKTFIKTLYVEAINQEVV